MRLLLDTHAFLFFVFGNRRLTRTAATAIENAEEVLVSAASGYEIALKHAAGKLPEASHVARDVGAAAATMAARLLPISMAHAEAAGRLPRHHRDPFDRILVAQALEEGLTLVSANVALDTFGIARLW